MDPNLDYLCEGFKENWLIQFNYDLENLKNVLFLGCDKKSVFHGFPWCEIERKLCTVKIKFWFLVFLKTFSYFLLYNKFSFYYFVIHFHNNAMELCG